MAGKQPPPPPPDDVVVGAGVGIAVVVVVADLGIPAQQWNTPSHSAKHK